jgi:membrane protein required for colicin V production
MNLLDAGILAILLMFAGMGALRGVVRELLSLTVWVVAIGSGWLFADAVGTWFAQLNDPDFRRLLAFVIIVVTMLAVLSVAVFVLRHLLPRPAPTWHDRAVAALLGALRGTVVVVVLVLLAGITPLPKSDGWHDSSLVGVFQPLATSILGWLPPAVARQFRYG